MKHSFGSDNHSGVHPDIMQSIISANNDFSIGYYEDDYSLSVIRKIEQLFGSNCSAFFVLNGTGANVLALSSLVHSTDAIICASTAHINVDECGAPDKFSGAKIVPIEHTNGKVSTDVVKKHLIGFGDQHHSQPKVLSISQSTELGTLYSVSEIKDLADLMHSYNGFLHLDGSRISNAAAALNVSLKEMTADVGVDCASFGGTKNGMLMGEVVIFFDEKQCDKTIFLRKQMSQLYSKGRFVAAQFDTYINDSLYLKMASHSNEMAKYLSKRIQEIKSIKISRPVESNAVFAYIPKQLFKSISQKHFFYIWDEETMEARWMCSFNTQKEDIDQFIIDIKSIIK